MERQHPVCRLDAYLWIHIFPSTRSQLWYRRQTRLPQSWASDEQVDGRGFQGEPLANKVTQYPRPCVGVDLLISPQFLVYESDFQ